MKYLLDTNAFWNILENWNLTASNLLTELCNDGKISFYLSEISAMEIHSVLGKYIRGKAMQEIKCERIVRNPDSTQLCNNTWISAEQKPLNRRKALDYIRLIDDILNNRNQNFNIEIIPLDSKTLQTGSMLLRKYAYRQDFQSLDAAIAATALETSKHTELTVITYDKKLKNVLKSEDINLK